MGGIFLRHGESFIPMHEAPYEAERVLQELLAEHPEVLAGDEPSDGAWLLVKREAGIADDPATGGRWSLDHLFIDADGVPTLVEVKRGADTRVRREIVAQMLDYAANAASYWTGESLKMWSELSARRTVGSRTKRSSRRSSTVSDPDDYWAKVQTNLAAGKLRLVFVSDAIPGELRRIVEFLNAKMTETEVLAYSPSRSSSTSTRTDRGKRSSPTCSARQKPPAALRVARPPAAGTASLSSRKSRRSAAARRQR
jgi:hypothetical protein